MVPPLMSVFEQLTDHRKKQSHRHPLSQTLALIVIALLHGETSLRGIASWLDAYRWHLKDPFGLRNGQVPSYGTIRRALISVDIEQLEQALIDWAQQIVHHQIGQSGYQLSLDGKMVQGSGHEDRPALQVLGAFVHELGVVLAQQAIPNGTNEIPVARDVLTQLTLEGVTVTTDALHTQQDTTETIVQKGGIT